MNIDGIYTFFGVSIFELRIDDNLIISDVQSDCTRVKMCDNTFSRGFKRYCMVTEGVRGKKPEKSILKSCKTRFTQLLKK